MSVSKEFCRNYMDLPFPIVIPLLKTWSPIKIFKKRLFPTPGLPTAMTVTPLSESGSETELYGV